MLKNFVIASTLVFALAAPAQAQQRDLGAGRLIAAQGNQALQMIKAELKNAIKGWVPAQPVKPAAVRTVRAERLAGASGPAVAVRCAP